MKKKVNLIVGLMMLASIPGYGQRPSPALLTPTNHSLVLIDFQGQMGFSTKNIDISLLRNNVALVAGASDIFKVTTFVTTVTTKSFSGPVFPEVMSFHPANTYLERTTMNAWEDAAAHKAITEKGKKRLVLAGLWTSVCVVDPALSALAEGYEVYIITDACGDVTQEAHEMGIQRMILAGAKPLTSLAYILELQRDWARGETYKAVTALVQKYGGAYGIGISYVNEMLKH